MSQAFLALQQGPQVLLASKKEALIAQLGKSLPVVQETRAQFLSGEVPLEKELAPHSSILACRIPWTEEPGGLQPRGDSRVRHALATKPPPRNRPSLSVRCQENRNKGATKVSGFIYLTKTYEAAK